MQRRVAVRGIIVNEKGEIFAMKFRQKDGTESDFWGTPGGGLDHGEPIIEGLRREIVEETGVAADIGKLLFIQQFPSMQIDRQEQFELFFHIKNYEDFEVVDLESTTHGAIELTRTAFVDPRVTMLLPKFLQEIDIVDYIENDKPVYIANYL